MACHEVAALRLGLMNVLGGYAEAERSHELAELGQLAHEPGPLCSLTQAKDLKRVVEIYDSTLVLLEEKLVATAVNDPKRAYLQTLVVFTKKVELELRGQVEQLHRLSREIEEMHDFIHELYPAEEV
jgi:hypothetical protein